MALTLTKGYTLANAETVTRAKLHALVDSATVNGAGTMAEQNASAVVITGGTADLSICKPARHSYAQETGYATSGAIQLNPDSKTNAYIGLAGNATFTVGTLAAGYYMRLLLKNTTGGSITLGWPAWNTPAGVTLPTSLAAGAYLIIRLECFGTTVGDVIATYN